LLDDFAEVHWFIGDGYGNKPTERRDGHIRFYNAANTLDAANFFVVNVELQEGKARVQVASHSLALRNESQARKARNQVGLDLRNPRDGDGNGSGRRGNGWRCSLSRWFRDVAGRFVSESGCSNPKSGDGG
jgi:hypothetical protein